MCSCRTNQGAGGFNLGLQARGNVPAVGDRPSTGCFKLGQVQLAIIKADHNDDCCRSEIAPFDS